MITKHPVASTTGRKDDLTIDSVQTLTTSQLLTVFRIDRPNHHAYGVKHCLTVNVSPNTPDRTYCLIARIIVLHKPGIEHACPLGKSKKGFQVFNRVECIRHVVFPREVSINVADLSGETGSTPRAGLWFEI